MNKRFLIYAGLGAFIVMVVFGWAIVAHGATLETDKLPGQDLDFNGLIKILNGLACWLIRIVGTILVIFAIIAGFQYMMSGGNPERLKQANQNFIYVLIGGLVIFGVGVIIWTVANAVGVDANLLPWVC